MLKIIMLRKKLSDARKTEEQLRAKAEELKTREGELAQAIEDATTESEKAAVEAAVEELETSQRDTKEALKSIRAEIDSLISDIEAAEAAQSAAAAGEGERSRRSAKAFKTSEEAAAFQRSGRTSYSNVPGFLRAALTSASTAGATGVDGINEAVGAPSSLLDMIKITDCTGMSAYRVAYRKTDAVAVAATEGVAPSATSPTYDSVLIQPTQYATLDYVSKEIRKRTALDYEADVRKAASRALRKVLTGKAVTAILASSLNTTFEVETAAIGPTLLSDLIISYGGDEAVEGTACLFLGKADLKAFAAVRGKNEYLPVYTIIPDASSPSTGIIKDNHGLSCRYCICADVPSLTGATAGAKTMFYGVPTAAELALWGEYDVEVSADYKFGEGLLAVRGEVTGGVDVTVPGGFSVVTLKA